MVVGAVADTGDREALLRSGSPLLFLQYYYLEPHNVGGCHEIYFVATRLNSTCKYGGNNDYIAMILVIANVIQCHTTFVIFCQHAAIFVAMAGHDFWIAVIDVQ